jgi:hypothetical protein
MRIVPVFCRGRVHIRAEVKQLLNQTQVALLDGRLDR